MAGTYLKKHAVIDLHVTHVQPPTTLHWRPSNSYQVNGQSSSQSNSGPAELKAVELTKLSYSHDTQISQINQGTREEACLYSYVKKTNTFTKYFKRVFKRLNVGGGIGVDEDMDSG